MYGVHNQINKSNKRIIIKVTNNKITLIIINNNYTNRNKKAYRTKKNLKTN